MVSILKDGLLIVTGAGGHIGSEVCRLLRTAEAKFVAVDVDPGTTKDLTRCDLRLKDQMSRLFQSHPVRADQSRLTNCFSSMFSREKAGLHRDAIRSQ